MYDTLLLDLSPEHPLREQLSEGIPFESFDGPWVATRTLLVSERDATLSEAALRGMASIAVTEELAAEAVRAQLTSYDDDPSEASLFLFDLGGVVVKNFTMRTSLVERFGFDRHEFSLDYEHYVFPLMEGFLSSEQYWARLVEHFDLPAFADDPFATAFTPTFNEEMVGVITALRAQGKRVVCASNTFDSHWQILKAMGVLALFDYPYASHLLQVAKPKRRFFELILEQEGAAEREVYFIDDSEENVAAARALGIKSMLYADTKSVGASDRLASAFSFL